MSFDLANLLSCLTLREVALGALQGDNFDLDYRRVFGGQLLAQTIQALRASADGKSLRSFTQYFPREGDVAVPISYEVTPYQVGRTFATLGVQLTQADKLISVASASLHALENGLDVPTTLPEVCGPDDAEAVDIGLIPWEIRVVGGVDINSGAARPAALQFWMRAANLTDLTADDSDWIHQSLLAHATDLTIIGTALLPVEGLSQADTGTAFHSAVTTHSLTFHQPFRVNDWLLVDQTAPSLTGGRAFGRGDVWSADGRLVASFAQESMVRLLDRSS